MNVRAVSEMEVQDGARRAPRWRMRLTPWLLMAPALSIALAFFGLPIVFMTRMSFNEHIDQRFYVPGFTFDNYAAMLTDPTFSSALWTTMRLALISSIVTVTIGYVFAMLVWLKPKRWRLLFIALALCPLLISEISIIFGWWMFFPKNGLLSYALTSSGLITDKISLMYTEFAAFVGLSYVIFILLSIFDGIDKKVLEASADLGAAPVRTFYEVLLPLTKGGVAAAFAQSFIWAIGTYATPSALGPDTLWTIGYLIQEQMLGKHNWPRAAAFSIVLTMGVAVVMVVIRMLTSKRTALNG
ncbi:ABC-type spermidine/putrescine transport system permease subunit I [Mesorhizobium soli]|uniref:ABC transporter permease n=1 Tax=Pseudaminobacter soli (ex Li et al. 2025) TaxID=1295366 RepID=UPI00247385C2|nr:ABC transporter permease [Mesorhizobium soli]MDH6233841.1 ABC-type spermidine/putrescine transport system permease subunit I [Mesorhizobium soli]